MEKQKLGGDSLLALVIMFVVPFVGLFLATQ